MWLYPLKMSHIQEFPNRSQIHTLEEKLRLVEESKFDRQVRSGRKGQEGFGVLALAKVL